MNTSCKFQGMGNMVVTINLTTTELSQMLLKDKTFRGIVDGLLPNKTIHVEFTIPYSVVRNGITNILIGVPNVVQANCIKITSGPVELDALADR